MADPKILKILMVEDSASDASLMRQTLATAAYFTGEITGVQRLDEAITAVKNGAFDACLLDLSLPDSMGIETCLLMREAAPRLPIVVLTGNTDDAASVEALRGGMQDYLSKPVDAQTIVRSIRYAIERKKREEELGALNRALRALSRSSKAMMRAEEEVAYLREVCSILTEDCGYSMVWVGYRRDDPEKSIRPVASAGFEAGYLETLKLTWADEPRGRGPTGTAIRTGRVSLCANMRTDPDFAPWREDALKRGYASSIVFPLMFEGKAFGAVTIYARDPEAFSPEEIGLLSELADDVTYGVTSIRMRVAALQTQTELAVSLTKLQVLFDSFPLGISITDETGTVIERNETAKRLFDTVSSAAETARPAVRLIKTDFTPLSAEELPEAIAIKEKRLVENVEIGIVKEESVTWVNVTAAPIPLEGYGVALAYGDFTQRRMAEDALRAERSLIEAVFQTTGGLIIGLDTRGRITLFNHACEKTTGYAFDEIRGKILWELLLVPEEADQIREMFKIFVSGNGPTVTENENYWIAKDGSKRYIRWANSVLLNASGAVEMIIGTGLDITEPKTMEELIRVKAMELLAANRELDAFSYSVSHDLRAPLHVITGFSQLLLDHYGDRLDEQGKEYLNLLIAEVGRMTRIIGDLLNLSRITRQEIRRVKVDLSLVASEIIDRLRREQPDRTVEAVIEPGLTAQADEGLMRIVLENLLGNAWKYTKNKPAAHIEFGSIVDKGRQAFFVRDNGAGFDMGHAQRLFTPFQRLHSKSEFDGTGIGLALVKRILSRHGGEAWAHSVQGEGARFYFTLR